MHTPFMLMLLRNCLRIKPRLPKRI